VSSFESVGELVLWKISPNSICYMGFVLLACLVVDSFSLKSSPINDIDENFKYATPPLFRYMEENMLKKTRRTGKK